MQNMMMHVLQLPILNKKGLHARAAAKFVKTASAYEADIKVRKSGGMGEEGALVNATSILGLMMLGADKGSMLEIHANGTQAEDALAALKELLETKFGEE